MTRITNPIKVGLIGTGSIAWLHRNAYKQFSDKIKLTAVCDINKEAVEKFAKTIDVDDVYTDPEKMLEKAEIDAVDICTIHDTHYPLTLSAIELGKHVLLEKPMAIKMEHCFEMVKKAEKAGIHFMVGQNIRYLPQSRHVHELIQNGELGEIWGAQCYDVMGAIPPKSKITKVPEQFNWYFDGNRSGGGALITLSIHSIDLFRYYIGEIQKVSGKMWTDNPMFTGGAEDRVIATLYFKNGALGHVLGSFTTTSLWSHRYMIYGEDGTIASDPPVGEENIKQFLAPLVISSKDRDAGLKNKFVPLHPNSYNLLSEDPYINEILHFAECCKMDKEPMSSGKDNLGTMKAVLGIYKSAKTGKIVDLDNL